MQFIGAHTSTLIVLPLVALIYLVYYLSFHVRRPHLVFPMTKLNNAIITSLPRLHRAYWPTFYVTHEIAQAAIGSFVRLDPRIKLDPHFEREIRTMADGEHLALDWLNGPTMNDDTPIVFTCHGLAGHTDELNMQYLALGVRDAGMRFAIFNRRGCALDMKLTKGQTSHILQRTSSPPGRPSL
jgi:predicted alpha/beta-fold hydrolase